MGRFVLLFFRDLSPPPICHIQGSPLPPNIPHSMHWRNCGAWTVLVKNKNSNRFVSQKGWKIYLSNVSWRKESWCTELCREQVSSTDTIVLVQKRNFSYLGIVAPLGYLIRQLSDVPNETRVYWLDSWRRNGCLIKNNLRVWRWYTFWQVSCRHNVGKTAQPDACSVWHALWR